MDSRNPLEAPIRFFLAEQTRALHDVLDARATAFDLSTQDGLKAFLTFLHRGIAAIEAGLEQFRIGDVFSDWHSRKRADILAAEAGALSDKATPLLQFRSEPEAWGGLYVLEGSRLGARVLLNSSPFSKNSQFLASSAASSYWPEFLRYLDEADDRLKNRGDMVEGAKRSFLAFS